MPIRKRRNPSGKIVWILDLGRGKGQRKTFSSETKAKTALAQEERKKARHGELIKGITSAQLADFVAAQNRLAGAGATILEAVEFFMQHGTALKEPLNIPDMVTRFIASRRAKNRSTDYVAQLGTSLGHFAKWFPLTEAHEVTPKAVSEWIDSGKWEAKTRNNYLGDVSAMFEWAIMPTQGYARVNPCVGIERAEDKRKGKRASLEVGQVEQMLRAAHEESKWRVLAFVVVGVFGGLRPEAEAADQKFLWSDINLDERTIRLTEEVVKTGPGRVVDLTPEAVAWLRLIPEELRTGPVVPAKNWQEEWMRFRHSLGWRVATKKGIEKRCLPHVEAVHGEWPKDVLRHTFASYHYAHHQNEALLLVQMGHHSAKMLTATYRAVRTRQEAAAFWALSPCTNVPFCDAEKR